MTASLFIGIDLGTSGIRASCIDDADNEIASASQSYTNETDSSDPEQWQHISYKLIQEITDRVDANTIHSICIDGTSGSVLLVDPKGRPRSPALMYNDTRSSQQVAMIEQIAPPHSPARGASSSLARCLYLLEHYPAQDTVHLCHQADWVAGCLTGNFQTSDENNCLKTGYDVIERRWPDWLRQLPLPENTLPDVLPAGTPFASVTPQCALDTGLPETCRVVSGTTDSIAAFIASGAKDTGDAVTSLGSTLAIKLLSEKPVFNSNFGIYSHRLELNNHEHTQSYWLAGGASNTGGRVLLKYFNQTQLKKMTPQLKPEKLLDLHYYPLPAPGERFPRNDSNLESQVMPRPKNDVDFFQALLEGIADIELEAYEKLNELGASPVKRIYTAGGGSMNEAWSKIRENKLGITVMNARHSEASYGAAQLAKQHTLKRA